MEGENKPPGGIILPVSIPRHSRRGGVAQGGGVASSGVNINLQMRIIVNAVTGSEGKIICKWKKVRMQSQV